MRMSMVLIIGGRAQGKRAFAGERFGVSSGEWSDGALCVSRAVFHLEEAARRESLDILRRQVKAQAEQFPDTVLVCNEIGCGVVPMEREEREWRERTGRLLCEIAAQSSQVWRVYCGIGVRIK